jgi:hypothetical protein
MIKYFSFYACHNFFPRNHWKIFTSNAKTFFNQIKKLKMDKTFVDVILISLINRWCVKLHADIWCIVEFKFGGLSCGIFFI